MYISDKGTTLKNITDSLNGLDYFLESIKCAITDALDVLDDTPEDSEPEELNRSIDNAREKLREVKELF